MLLSLYTRPLISFFSEVSECDDTVLTFNALTDSTVPAQTDNPDPLITNHATENNVDYMTLHYGTTSVISSYDTTSVISS